MGLFNVFAGKKGKNRRKVTVEMRGYVNGKEVALPQDAAPDDDLYSKKIDYRVVTSEIKPLEDVMIGFAVALKARHSVENEIALLSSIIESFYSLKSKCVSLGPDYEEYFSKMWEHCRNSENQDYSYIEKFEERLGILQKNKDVLLAEEALKNKELVNLEQRVMKIIEDENEILQTDIYERFDPVVRDEISSILYFMAKNGEIRRIKRGRTYLVLKN